MFNEIPTVQPSTPLLDQIANVADLRQIPRHQLPQLSVELRHFFLYCVGQTGGHFGANLGVVELTIALHYVLNTPEDLLVWDVGHQSYPHKILTGRRQEMFTIRQGGGIAGFPKRDESPFDTFGTGHSSTSISAALGMALALRQQGRDQRVVAVIGDGAMTAGMSFEALNHAAHTRANLLVILNDNQMSISENKGGLASYFARMWSSRLYINFREGGKKVLSKIPPAKEFMRRTEEHVKGMFTPGTLFEELGFNYTGPLDGHDVDLLVATLTNLQSSEGPQLLHIITEKGKGFAPAEKNPVGYHAIEKIEAKSKPPEKRRKYQKVFGDWICHMAQEDPQLVGITPAMKEGSGLVDFAQRFPQRFFDVAIAEQHAVTLAAGMACEGLKPVVAIYSTFLQRAYDQLIHDVALQNLDVLFAIDRAGLVGEDGPSHAGSFDLSYLRCLPNIVVMTPSDENETRLLLTTGYHHQGVAVVRYPRGAGPGTQESDSLDKVEIGRSVVRRTGQGVVTMLVFGTPLVAAMQAAEAFDATVVDMRFVKPLDEALIMQQCNLSELLVTIEENVIAGGAGTAVSELLSQHQQTKPLLQIGLPDRFLPHDNVAHQRKLCTLDASGIEQKIRSYLDNK